MTDSLLPQPVIDYNVVSKHLGNLVATRAKLLEHYNALSENMEVLKKELGILEVQMRTCSEIMLNAQSIVDVNNFNKRTQNPCFEEYEPTMCTNITSKEFGFNGDSTKNRNQNGSEAGFGFNDKPNKEDDDLLKSIHKKPCYKKDFKAFGFNDTSNELNSMKVINKTCFKEDLNDIIPCESKAGFGFNSELDKTNKDIPKRFVCSGFNDETKVSNK